MTKDFTIATAKGRLTEEEALDSELDILPALESLEKLDEFRHQLYSCRSQIELLVARHLGILKSEFSLTEPCEWIVGGFNICLPIILNCTTKPKLPPRVLFRIPLPFGVGEDFSPGSIDEKLRCEAATYVWLHRDCPAIPIPRLLGIGFPGTQSFTAVENESLWNWGIWRLRYCVSWLRGDRLSPYFAHPQNIFLETGYLILECVEEGKMLSSSWQQYRNDKTRRRYLYEGLARILLSLAKVSLPQIGSWTMDNRGVISLANRPLSELTLIWNRHSIPTAVPRNMTYTSAESFIHDMLSYQDNRMRHQPNSVIGKNDGIYQLSALTSLRALLPRFCDQSLRSGPFVLTLTDLHQSNIFVDDDWNILCVIDLEFAPVQPVHMVHVPYWLSNRGVDELDGSNLEEYEALYHEFVDILEKEETTTQHTNNYSRRLREDLSTGRLWYTMALRSVNAFPMIFEQHLRPRFFEEFHLQTDGIALARIWNENALEFIATKLKDRQQYEQTVHKIFAEARARHALVAS